MTRKILAAAVCERGGDEQEMVELRITDERLHASGVFSNVYQAHLVHPEERQVAIKKIWPKDGQRNNDLHFLQQLSHPHIVRLLYHFNVTFDKHRRCECLVFEFLPTDLAKAQKESRSRPMDLLDVKLYTWQMFCALGYLNKLGVAHRDVKPSNLLCDPETGVLKLGDFGSAKRLVRGEKSTSYQVTRYYRAPELLFESVHYTPDIDIWAGACVLGELLIGNVMLAGRSKDDQTRIVIELFGYPSEEDCAAMHVARPRFARRPARGIRNLFPNRTPMEAFELLESILQYAPHRRLRVAAILNHRFYDDLRARPLRIRTNGRPLPMQQFTTEEPTPPNATEAPPDDAHQ